MKIQVDQSGKIEQTNRDTILCLSNENWLAIRIPARAKRQIQEIFRRNGQIRNYILFTFSTLLFILLKNIKVNHVVIDREYYGKEAVIKKIISELNSLQGRFPSMTFGYVGKKSMAHNRAHAVAIGKLKAQKVVSLKEVLNEIKRTEVGKRLKNA